MDSLSYEYMVHTWGGFYNPQHARLHRRTPGYRFFYDKADADAYVDELLTLEKALNAHHLCIARAEGYHVRFRTVLNAIVVDSWNIGHLVRYDMGYAYEREAAEYHMENKWDPTEFVDFEPKEIAHTFITYEYGEPQDDFLLLRDPDQGG